MADVELPDLPAAVVLNTSDLLHIRQGLEDKKSTISLLHSNLDTIYLRQDDNLFSVDNVVTARSNLDVLSTTEASDAFLEEANNLSDLDNTTTARNNLGLGTAATVDTGTGVGDIPVYATSTTLTGNVTGNSATSDKWSTARTLTLGTDLTGNVVFDGSANFTLDASVVNDSHTHTLSTVTDSGTMAALNSGTGANDFRDNDQNDIRSVVTFDTLSDVIADTSLKLGVGVFTRGYTTINDGGGARYFVSTSTDTDDGGLRIDLDNGLQAQLITGDKLNIRQFGAFGDYINDDTTALINVLLAYEATQIPVYLPHGTYNITKSINLPDSLVMYGDGSPVIATFPQTGGDKSLLRPGFKDQISGSSLIFTAVDLSYVTTRVDRYSTQTYAMASLNEGPIRLSGFAIIQDMDVLDSGGTLTTSTNNNLVPIGAGFITQSTLSQHTDITVFGYFGNAGLIIHNPQTGVDPEYNRFTRCNISGGTAIIGNDTAGGTASGGITGMTFVDGGYYGSDNHTRSEGDYTIPVIFMDGFLIGAQAGIRGHTWTGCNLRGFANNAISTDHVDDFGFANCTTEFALLAGVANADQLGGFTGTSNTKNFRAFNLPATNDLNMGTYLATITGKFQVMGAGIFDNAMFGESGSGVRMFASTASGNSTIQLTDDFTSIATGWSINKDVANDNRLDLRFDNVTVTALDKDGGWSTAFGLANGGTKIISAGVITITNNSYFSVDTEASAATDDLERIDGGTYDGQIIIIKTIVSGRDVTVKDTAAGGNIRCAGDFTLSNPQDRMQLMFDGSNFVEISRSDNTT